MITLQELGIPRKKQEILRELQIDSVVDLLTHYPFRYDIIETLPFSEWQPLEKVCFEAKAASPLKTQFFKAYRSVTKFRVLYEEEIIEVAIFNRHYLKLPAEEATVTIVGRYEGNHKVVASNINFKSIEEQLGIHPIYNTKSGVSQRDLTMYIRKALQALQGKIVDVVPANLLEKYKMVHKEEAIKWIHFPETQEDLKQGLRHLKYEEFLKFHITMLSIKKEETQLIKGKAKAVNSAAFAKKLQSLPFALTNGQQEALQEIMSDLQDDTLMYRLLQGDVGCGKTIVAGLAMYATVLAGQQACMMAPTEILAKQHAISLAELFPDCRIALLCASLKSQEKKEVLQQIASHNCDMIVGTHALFQENVVYANLGLVIADEQHRFGVEQRRKLREKGQLVDFLLMSATPIPRTLALSLYGDMSVSTISELPKGRQPVITKVIKENTMASILPEIMELLDQNQQCYVICPMISESETMDLKHAQGIYASMKKVLGRKYQLGLLHGKMTSEEKEEIMAQFQTGQIQILVSTTVVEVGVNVPSANCMVIYDANRFGLSQLHQLRGRVGRGSEQGYCYLLCPSKNKEAMERLEVLERVRDGFEIAREDLRLRGPGEILGKRQSGASGFVLGDIMIDSKMLEIAREDAVEITKEWDRSEYQTLRKWLAHIQQSHIHYID